MQYCETCGAKLPNNAQFCRRCGTKTKSEDEVSTKNNNTPIENAAMFPEEVSTALGESQDSIAENEQQEQDSSLLSENDTEAEEHSSSLATENEKEERPFESTSEKSQEQFAQYPVLEPKLDEQSQKDPYDTTGLMQGEIDSEPEVPANQPHDEQLQNAQNPMPPPVIQNSYTLPQKSRIRPTSRCLLFSLAGLIIIVGLLIMLISMLHFTVPGFGGSSNAQSGSAYNVSINPTGSSLTASVCMNTSTPSTSSVNQGTVFTLLSSTGCSTLVAAKADSSCLIFPNPTSASRKYIVDVSNAAINSQSYHLVLGIEDFTGPSSYSDARHISMGLSEGSTSRTFSWLYHSGKVTINNDEQSGAMDVILTAVNSRNTIHMVGNWACGRQIKST